MNDNPWFVRRGSGWCCSIQPRAPMGWLLTAAYSTAITVLTLFVERFEDHLGVWVALLLSATALFVTMAYRFSVPGGPRGCKGGGIGIY